MYENPNAINTPLYTIDWYFVHDFYLLIDADIDFCLWNYNHYNYLCFRSFLRTSDSAVHGFIGALSWQLICLLCPFMEFNMFHQIACCFFGHSFLLKNKEIISSINSAMNFGVAFTLSCFIDVDHVLHDFVQAIQVS